MIRIVFFFILLLTSMNLSAQVSFSIMSNDSAEVAWLIVLNELEVETSGISSSPHIGDLLDQGNQCNLDKSLANLGGIWMVRRGEFAAEPVIRGLSSGRLNLTIDGMRVLGACTDKMDPITSYVEPFNLEKLTVGLGAEGSDYGCNIGGALNFHTKRPHLCKENPIKGSVGLRYNSVNNFRSVSSHLNFSKGKWAYRIGAVLKKADDYRAGGGEKVNFTSYNKFNGQLSVSYFATENSLLNVEYIADEAWDVGYAAMPMDVASAKAKLLNFNYEVFNISSLLTEWKTKLYVNKVDHLMDDSQRDVPVRMDMPGYTNTMGLNSTGTIAWSALAKTVAQINYYRTQAYADMTMYGNGEEVPPMFMVTWPDIRKHSVGVSANNEFRLNSNFLVIAKGRMEWQVAGLNDEVGKNQFQVFGYDQFVSNQYLVNAVAGSSVKVAPGHWFDLNLAYAERAADESEQFGFYLFNSYDGYDYLGQPTIQKEKSTQVELSYRLDKERISVEANLFTYLINDYIMGVYNPDLQPMTPGSNGVKEYKNIASANLTGGELLAVYQQSHFSWMNSVKYTFGEDHSGAPLPLIPPLKWLSSLTVRPLEGLSVSFNYTLNQAQDRINPFFGETETPGSHIFDLYCNYDFRIQDQRFKANLSVENVLDVNYKEHLDWGNIPRPGRNIGLGITYVL